MRIFGSKSSKLKILTKEGSFEVTGGLLTIKSVVRPNEKFVALQMANPSSFSSHSLASTRKQENFPK